MGELHDELVALGGKVDPEAIIYDDPVVVLRVEQLEQQGPGVFESQNHTPVFL
jgi:hypothetical protein